MVYPSLRWNYRICRESTKKYQDIYPLNFDQDYEGLLQEVLRIIRFWIAKGVTLFRVDNPHTKPVHFWHELLTVIHNESPEIIFLAEAFTRPAMMQALAKAGFHQSYTYFHMAYDEARNYFLRQ